MYSCTLTFQTLLGSFVQRTSLNNLAHFLHRRSRCFASAKILLFPFPPTLFEKKIHLFFLFPLSAVSQRFANWFYRHFAFFYDGFDTEKRILWLFPRGFYNKNITNWYENPKNMNRIACVFISKWHTSCPRYTRISTDDFYPPRIGTNLTDCFSPLAISQLPYIYTLLINIGTASCLCSPSRVRDWSGILCERSEKRYSGKPDGDSRNALILLWKTRISTNLILHG